jgi:hypothetical protein
MIYVTISIAVLVAIAILIFVVRRNGNRNQLTPLASLASGFVLAGILFGDHRVAGYSLMGVGVLFAVIDMFNRSKGG